MIIILYKKIELWDDNMKIWRWKMQKSTELEHEAQANE